MAKMMEGRSVPMCPGETYHFSLRAEVATRGIERLKFPDNQWHRHEKAADLMERWYMLSPPHVKLEQRSSGLATTGTRFHYCSITPNFTIL